VTLNKHQIDEIVDELLDDLPLQEQVIIANMSEFDVSVLQTVFGKYINALVGTDDDPDEILVQLWERLRKTHKLRVVR
jgi:flagellar motor switch protein FliG